MEHIPTSWLGSTLFDKLSWLYHSSYLFYDIYLNYICSPYLRQKRFFRTMKHIPSLPTKVESVVVKVLTKVGDSNVMILRNYPNPGLPYHVYLCSLFWYYNRTHDFAMNDQCILIRALRHIKNDDRLSHHQHTCVQDKG